MPRDPLILAFDTSAAHCAAALLGPGGILAERVEDMAKGQAERLMPMLAELLAEAGRDWSDVTAIGVGIGPGNFTGVRISVAAARGLALSLGVPAVGVTRLEALACGLPASVAVIEDARRDEAYVLLPGEAPRLCALADLPDLTGRSLVGSAAEIAAVRAGGTPCPPALPLAVAIARLAAERAGTAQPRPAPLYLRAADAAPPSELPPRILP